MNKRLSITLGVLILVLLAVSGVWFLLRLIYTCQPPYCLKTTNQDKADINQPAVDAQTSGWKTYVWGNSSIQYPDIANPVFYPPVAEKAFPGMVEFGFTRYPLTVLNHVYIRKSDFGNTIPSGTYKEMNNIGWTRFEIDKTLPSEIYSNQNLYVREISYGVCETGCFGLTLAMDASSKDAFSSDEANYFTSIFEKMMTTYKLPANN